MNRALIDSFHELLRQVKLQEDGMITCAECSSLLDAFAVLTQRGFNVPELTPLIQAHLDKCEFCSKEFEEFVVGLEKAVA